MVSSFPEGVATLWMLGLSGIGLRRAACKSIASRLPDQRESSSCTMLHAAAGLHIVGCVEAHKL